MAISLRLTKEDEELFKKYAALNGITVSELIRQSVLQRIENEHDMKAYNAALEMYQQNPQTVSLNMEEE